ncbi:MAG: cryptochrome/photolyase family protein, partial [Phycisphaerales bacterium JB038]
MTSAAPKEPLARLRALRVKGRARRLAIVFGDQLDLQAPLLRSLSKSEDVVLMMEVAEEAQRSRSHRQRTLLFLAAMRHFALELAGRGYRVEYIRLSDPKNTHAFGSEIERAARRLQPRELVCTQLGEWGVLRRLEASARRLKLPLRIDAEAHFLTGSEEFEEWMAGRKQQILEHFYRWQRRRLAILIDAEGAPVGGQWNFDKENRRSFRSPPTPPTPYRPRVDALTRATAADIEKRLPDSPGSLQDFRWPVTRGQARRALRDFVENRLPHFGDYQDAMWSGEAFLYHALLAPALNLKLLDPRECIRAVVEAWENGAAPLNAVEGFLRQIIGWREFLRGLYWHQGESYAERNGFAETGRLPDFYWTGETEMACLRDCLGQVLQYGYGHHIQRLMVTGNLALVAGVEPQQVNDWYRGMYVDAVDWVTTPNVIGMVMHADGGVVGSKPYAASGRYIERMSNYCQGCPYDP